MISPMRYEVEIQAPLSTPVPMPPSMSSSEALVIWILRIAMKAPIMLASTAIQSVVLAFSEDVPAGGESSRAVCVRLDIESLLPWLQRESRRITSICGFRRRGNAGHGGPRIDRWIDRHPGPKHDRQRACLVEHDLHGDALHHLGE